MNDTPGQTLSCPGCGKQFAWQPHFAGRRVACKCGTAFQAPSVPPAEDDVYDVIDVPVPAAAPAQQPVQPVLQYQSKVVVKQERRAFRDRILAEWRVKDVWLPLSLIVLGVACRVGLSLSHHTEGNTRAAVVLGLVATGTAFNVLVMLVGVLIASRLVDLEPGPALPAVVKLGLIFVIAASAGGWIASLGHFGTLGITVGVHAIIVIYWILFSLMFQADLTETMMCVAIMGVLQAILNLGIWMYMPS